MKQQKEQTLLEKALAHHVSPNHMCECPNEGAAGFPASSYMPEERKAMFHKPDACPGDWDVRLYRRGDRLLWLCSCCHLLGDIEQDSRVATLREAYCAGKLKVTT